MRLALNSQSNMDSLLGASSCSEFASNFF